MDRHQTPIGVKIISVFYYIDSFLNLISGAIMLSVGTVTLGMAPILGLPSLGSFIIGGFIGGIILVGFGMFKYFIASGLWKGQNWARIVAIFFANLGIILAVFSIIQREDIVWKMIELAIDIVIVGYLMFSRKVKNAFIIKVRYFSIK